MELVIWILIALFIFIYRRNDGSESFYNFTKSQFSGIYDKYAPYSFKTISAKMKDLKQEYTTKDYILQIVVFGGIAGGIAYLYFYSLIMVAIYGGIAIALIPYLAWLRSKRLYSEYLFEQIQVYTTNVIMEFNTTQSFVKSLEGVRDSGILEDPVLEDVKTMINMSYQNGTIDEERYQKLNEKINAINEIKNILRNSNLQLNEETKEIFKKHNLEVPSFSVSLYILLKRPEISINFIKELIDIDYTKEILEEVEIEVKYEGYIAKAYKEAEKMLKLEDKIIPDDIDYNDILNLASEARQKLAKVRPKTLGQAARISGVNPADLSILSVYLKKKYNK